ncbi:hypothetical protein G6F59_017691 [Rhizopus arrhizus]|nr:hypothetical protein G6F59_017691 [Rhizopus arrhizus]
MNLPTSARMAPRKDSVGLDVSTVVAGPLCGQYLGELGARVIKVEPVGTGDDTRAWLPQDAGQSATFLAGGGAPAGRAGGRGAAGLRRQDRRAPGRGLRHPEPPEPEADLLRNFGVWA